MPFHEHSPPDGTLELWPLVTDGYSDDNPEFQSSFPFPFPLSSSPPSSMTVDMGGRSGSNQSGQAAGSGGWALQVELRIALYVAIFVLSVAGNALVALTIAQNRRMRTLTNVLLMNLSVADLLLAAFCMPFTLVPTLLRDFIFGPVVCVMVRYMQGEQNQHRRFLFSFHLLCIARTSVDLVATFCLGHYIHIFQKRVELARHHHCNSHICVMVSCSLPVERTLLPEVVRIDSRVSRLIHGRSMDMYRSISRLNWLLISFLLR